LSSWSSPLPAPSTNVYDLIVIGAGPAGEKTAIRATRGGLTALIIECELVGGECPYWACVPSKAILRPLDALEAASVVGGAREVVSEGEHIKKPVLDGVWKRRDFFSKNWTDDANLKLMADHKVDVVRGFGRIAGVKKVSVQAWGSEERVEYEARHAVAVSTGSEPIFPDEIHGLQEAKPWTPREAVSTSSVPEHLIIVGAGPVGSELATAFVGLGGKVTLITGGGEVLGRFEPEAGRKVREALVKKGVDVRLGTRVVKVDRQGEGKVEVQLSGGEIVSGSEILIAAGRKPRTTDIGLETIGLKDGSVLHVDDTLCVHSVSGEWLYAVGDTNAQAPLTHMGTYSAKVAGDTIAARAKGTLTKQATATAFSPHSATAQQSAYTPQVTFTDPQVASVGLTLAQALKEGKKAREVATKMAGPGTFLHAESYDGWAQWVVDEESSKLLGATFVGGDTADLLHASTVAIVGGVDC
jgi:pyruvate/2-oxoglutarate dehydrogenase complex dihydrolipoamide dehydrogenase (E3) component